MRPEIKLASDVDRERREREKKAHTPTDYVLGVLALWFSWMLFCWMGYGIVRAFVATLRILGVVD